jgi:hypothetical protein
MREKKDGWRTICNGGHRGMEQPGGVEDERMDVLNALLTF